MTRRTVAWVVGILVVAGAGAASLPALRGIGVTSDLVPSFEVERGAFVHRVQAEGNLRAVEATTLGPPADNSEAVKIAWLAPDGSFVTEGDVVIRFDPTEMEDNLRSGMHDRATADCKITQRETLEEASVHALATNAKMASLELDFAREFQSKDSTVFTRIEIIESEIDQGLATERKAHAEAAGEVHSGLAASELELLAIERRKAQMRVDQAERGLQKLEVRAPHDGTFLLRETWNGIPQVGQTVWGGQPVAEIPRLDRIEAKVFVLEADAGGVQVGQRATLTVDAFPERSWPAKVAQIDTLAQRRNRRVPIQYFGVTLELEETDTERMKPGSRVQAVLHVADFEDAVAIPRQAVFERDGSKIVYVASGSGYEPVEVVLGAASLGRVVVTSGLEPGQRIALRDPTRSAAPSGDEPREPGGGRRGPMRGSG